jgi:hypothetical protein
MSGGSLNYVYEKVDYAADALLSQTNEHFRALGKFMKKLAPVLHDVEWAISCDYSDDRAEESIKTIISPEFELAHALEEAKATLALLETAIKRVNHDTR